MIFFPFVFEDEILYSAMARYHWISGNINPRASMLDMFGSPNVCSTVLFPANLKAFCERLPLAHKLMPDEIIDNHTFLPYYELSVPYERIIKIKNIMTHERGASIYMSLGIAASGIKKGGLLKYCPICAHADSMKYGESYWHRSHQAEGVVACYKHECFLIESSVKLNQRHKFEMITLNNYIKSLGTINKDERKCSAKELFLAQQSHDLLNMKSRVLGLESIRKYYIDKLQELDIVTTAGRVRWMDLISRFTYFYGKEFLLRVDSYIAPGIEDTWLHKLLRFPRVTCHPMRHILVLGFLKENVSSLAASLTHGKQKNIRNQYKKIIKPTNTSAQLKPKLLRIDWEKRDKAIASKIALIAEEIKNTGPRLIRVTKTEIGRQLRMQSLLVRAIHKLPLTSKALNESVESLEQFQIRRIRRTIKRLLERQPTVLPWEVKRAAGLRKVFELKYEELIKEEIQKQVKQSEI
ncbi:TnsD family Tn7-like transposition protein [Paenibacillus polymyxa]|uniref:TnsD family Tn7-like transposition protein n=1 Tax=Paenibacillus polymyxa TaxID=1406 RepID=UPI00030037F3|nr:TnsD family Tn7-like transposition protein [Paenibacillus polymyxa]NMP07615.1 hypothetical protein [Paenibacillus polymyxa]